MGVVEAVERNELVLRCLLTALACGAIVALPDHRLSRALSVHENAMMPGNAQSQLASEDRNAIIKLGVVPCVHCT